MPSTPHASSPAPKGLSVDEELAYYKAQYEQMEADLQDFQASSRELEQELERDIEQSEKRERHLKEKLDNLGFEVEEWKTKHKQAKAEANNAQNLLQKEITKLRDDNRTLILKLRDIEVANDDFEQQARHQTSSLEDLESKYNVGIEHHVMLEEEVRVGEQERESLRIETQRLRDELSDLRIEADIIREKLRIAEETIERHHARQPRQLDTGSLRPPSPASEASTSATNASFPQVFTPPPSKSATSTVQSTPPSPPLSDASAKANVKKYPVTPAKYRTLDNGLTPTTKTSRTALRQPPRHSRGLSIPPVPPTPRMPVPPVTVKRAVRQSSRPSMSAQSQPLPRSGSLYQMSRLIDKVQKLEEKVHSVRSKHSVSSKLPAPTATPPRASPRGATLGSIPSSVTLRSRGKRESNSTATSDQPRSVSRLSFGASAMTRPEHHHYALTGGGQGDRSRPSSRASASSHTSATGGVAATPYARPQSSHSRTSVGGNRAVSVFAERRPGSSMSGSYYASTVSSLARTELPGRSGTPGPRSRTPGSRQGHGHSQSVSGFTTYEEEDSSFGLLSSQARRTTLEKGLSAIPAPVRRQSGGVGSSLNSIARRQSNSALPSSLDQDVGRPSPGSRAEGLMAPPRNTIRTLAEVGETF